jgi:hypothetical protein
VHGLTAEAKAGVVGQGTTATIVPFRPIIIIIIFKAIMTRNVQDSVGCLFTNQ